MFQLHSSDRRYGFVRKKTKIAAHTSRLWSAVHSSLVENSQKHRLVTKAALARVLADLASFSLASLLKS